MDGTELTYSARAAARRLGTSAPRVLRAVDQLGMHVERSAGGRARLSSGQIERLRAHLGSMPSDTSLSRVQAQMLAALDRSPRGVASIRALAERAGVSPTTATKHLAALRARGLVGEDARWVAEGRARRRTVLSLNDMAPEWPALAATVRRVQLPSPPRQQERRVPRRLEHLFWNVAEAQKDVASAGPVIARRLIETADIDGLAWGLTALSPADWKHAARTRGISPQRRAMAENFSAAVGNDFLYATTQSPIEEPSLCAGLQVAGLRDILAMKVKVIGDRPALRDYFDLKLIEQRTGLTVDEGLRLYMRRYGIGADDASVAHILTALGYLDDVDPDDQVPEDKAVVEQYWRGRQPQIVVNASRRGPSASTRPAQPRTAEGEAILGLQL